MTHLCRSNHIEYETCTNKEFPYERGYKLCKTCNIHIKYEGRFCPCCGYLLRIKNRHIKQNKWSYESWNIMRAIEIESLCVCNSYVLKVEYKKDRRTHAM